MAVDKISLPRLCFALAVACLIGGEAESRKLGQAGHSTLAAIEHDDPTVGMAADAGTPIGPTNAAATEPVRMGNPLWAIPMRKLSATRERPLFTASRRPPTPVIAAAPAPAPAPAPVQPSEPDHPPLILVGTIIGDNERIAIFVNQLSNETKRVREGEEELGWVVRSVELRATVLEKNHLSVTLGMPKRAEPPAGGPAPPPSRPANDDTGL